MPERLQIERIGVVGIGVLGDAIKKFYESNGDKIYCYDKDKRLGSVKELNKADLVFVCVPTPRGQNDECDISIVDEVIGYLTGEKIVVIKSTVIPFTTDKLQIKYPRHTLIFNPEFLTEKRAFADFCNPTIQIVGYTGKCNEAFACGLLKILPPARFSKIMPAAAAEMFKYVRNSYLAAKNSFFSQIHELCRQTGINYEFIKETAENDPWIGREHLDPFRDGYRGFNGKCLPKDTEAFLMWAKKRGSDLSVLERVIESNSALLASQNIKKDS
ncbi:MAG: hypothetical protein AAB456_03005 [Patescibacteria group bacterium]